MAVRALTVIPICGLANRMRSIASAVALADYAGVPLQVLWPVDADLRAPYEALFDPQALQCRILNISATADRWIYDVPRRRNLYFTHLTHRAKFDAVMHDGNGLAAWQDDDALAQMWISSSHGRGLIRSAYEFYNYSDALYRSMFRPQRSVEERVAEILGDDSGAQMVGMHIRRTDHTEAIRLNPDSKYEAEIERLIRECPDVRIYVASDDEDLKQRLCVRYGRAIIVAPTVADRGSVAGMQDALAELLILSRCKRLIGSEGSSFSDAAKKLSTVTPLRM